MCEPSSSYTPSSPTDQLMARIDSWATFDCEHPDFVVRSVLDNVSFKVNRTSMCNSRVFHDMFSIGQMTNQDEMVDIHETSAVLIVLLRLLHYPPTLPEPLPVDKDLTQEQLMLNYKLPKKLYDPATVIPLPLLQTLLYGLVDKYSISDTVTESLNGHLLAHAHVFPLSVYGFAAEHGLSDVASAASQYLQPLASYPTVEAKAIPDVVAYHKVVRLQALRVKALREIVLGEDIFPHGYGTCSYHLRETPSLWHTKRQALASAIETDTDISGEMDTVIEALPPNCKTCRKACTAAVQMLAYKSQRIIKRIDQLPEES